MNTQSDNRSSIRVCDYVLFVSFRRRSVRHRRGHVLRHPVARQRVESSVPSGTHGPHGVPGARAVRPKLLRADVHEAVQAPGRPVRALHVRRHGRPEGVYTGLAGRELRQR